MFSLQFLASYTLIENVIQIMKQQQLMNSMDSMPEKLIAENDLTYSISKANLSAPLYDYSIRITRTHRTNQIHAVAAP